MKFNSFVVIILNLRTILAYNFQRQDNNLHYLETWSFRCDYNNNIFYSDRRLLWCIKSRDYRQYDWFEYLIRIRIQTFCNFDTKSPVFSLPKREWCFSPPKHHNIPFHTKVHETHFDTPIEHKYLRYSYALTIHWQNYYTINVSQICLFIGYQLLWIARLLRRTLLSHFLVLHSLHTIE